MSCVCICTVVLCVYVSEYSYKNSPQKECFYVYLHPYASDMHSQREINFSVHVVYVCSIRVFSLLTFREGVVLHIWHWKYILHKPEVLKTKKEIFRHVSIFRTYTKLQAHTDGHVTP